jgi:predicted ribosomally synthesized peptide with nif11-like leader
MTNFPPELIEKAKTAKSAEELLELAKAAGVEITAEEAVAYFAQLNPSGGELDDDDLDNVAGGACYNKDGYRKIANNYQKCDLFDCGCGAFRRVKKSISADKCENCGTIVACVNCSWKVDQVWTGGYCSNPATRKS